MAFWRSLPVGQGPKGQSAQARISQAKGQDKRKPPLCGGLLSFAWESIVFAGTTLFYFFVWEERDPYGSIYHLAFASQQRS